MKAIKLFLNILFFIYCSVGLAQEVGGQLKESGTVLDVTVVGADPRLDKVSVQSTPIYPPLTKTELDKIDEFAVIFVQKRFNPTMSSQEIVFWAYEDAKALVLKRRESAGAVAKEIFVDGQKYVPVTETRTLECTAFGCQHVDPKIKPIDTPPTQLQEVPK